MALIDYKFYEDNFVGKRISDLSDSPSSDGMTAEALKAYFDYMPKTMIALGAVNKIIDLLVSSSGAENIGASVSGVTGTQIQAILESVKIMLDDRYTKSAADGLLDTKADNTTVNAMVKSISFNKDTGVFTIIEQGGSTYTIDTLLEKLAVNFRYDKPTQSLIITNSDGSTQTVSLSDFITETEIKSTDTISVTDTGGVITLNIKSGSITDDMLSSTLLAMIQGYVQSCASSAASAESSASNARDYSDSAANSASTALESKNAAGMSEQAAKQSKTDAADERLKAESWARGTKNNVSVPESDETYHNNSKWYSEQAAGSASDALRSKNAASESENKASKSELAASDNAAAALESKNAAAQSALSAADSSASAHTSMEAASNSETNAAKSEKNALLSEQAAAKSQNSSAQSANDAARCASSAAESASEAEMAQVAAEKARDEAQEIAGGNYVTGSQFSKHTENGDVHTTPEEKNAWNNKVDKAEGKGLSSNDYINTDKNKVKNLPDDTNLALGKKVDKEAGKTLSSNDYSNEEKNKLGTLNTASIKNENISIPASSWAIDSENTFEDYPYKVTVPISGIDDSWYLKLITPDHTNRDLDSFFCQFFNTVEGGVEIWGESLPTSDIVIENMVFEKVI